VSAIFPLDDLPKKWKQYAELNASYVQGGRFTSGEYAKHSAKCAGCRHCERPRNQSLQGQQALHGILLWQSHANAQGGIPSNGGMSRPVRLIWYDDGSRVSRTRENVLRLIRNDSVDILLGPYSSSLTMAAAEIAEEYKKILWNYGGTSDEIFSHGWRYMIAIASPASDYLRALPQWLVKQYPKRCRICVLYSSQGTFGWQVARGVLESAPETRQRFRCFSISVPKLSC